MGQIYAPFAMLFVGRGLQRLRHVGIEAATLFVEPRRRLTWIVNALRAELIGVWCLIFALALGNFAVPHVMQCRLFVISIYMRAANYFDHLGAIVAALPIVITCVVAAIAVTVIDSRSRSASMHDGKKQSLRLGRFTWPVRIAAAFYIVASVFLPIIALLYECKSASLFLQAARDAGPELRNTLVLAVSVTVIAVAGSVVLRTLPASWTSACCTGVSFALIGVPSLVIALVYTRFFSQVDSLGFSLHRSIGIAIVCGLVCRVWPYVARAASEARLSHHPTWDEASRIAGMSAWRRWRWIALPTNLDYVLAAAIIAFVLAAGDIEISQMLCEPGQGTLTVRLFTFLHFGPTHVTASLALLQLLLTSIPVLLYFLICERFLRLV